MYSASEWICLDLWRFIYVLIIIIIVKSQKGEARLRFAQCFVTKTELVIDRFFIYVKIIIQHAILKCVLYNESVVIRFVYLHRYIHLR